MAASRARRPVHSGIVPWLVVSVVVAVSDASVVVVEDPRSSIDLRYGFAVAAVPVLAGFAAYLGWHSLVGYGLFPLVVVWRCGDSVWVGTPFARAGISRKRLKVNGSDIRVESLDAIRKQPVSGHVAYRRVSSGGANIDLRTYGCLDADELQEFLSRTIGALRDGHSIGGGRTAPRPTCAANRALE